LKRATGDNCSVNGTIKATASNTCGGTLNILFDKSDYGSSSHWMHNNVKDGWFQMDFKDRRIVMTHYAIHNNLYYVSECHFLKTWTVEGSNDGTKWSLIDSRTNDETLHGKDKLQSLFVCNGDAHQHSDSFDSINGEHLMIRHTTISSFLSSKSLVFFILLDLILIHRN
jgi:hypothetical protein